MKFTCITSVAFSSVIISLANAKEGPRTEKNLRSGAVPAQHRSLGGNNDNGNGQATHAKKRGLRPKLATNDCTIMAIEALGIEEGEDPEMILECEMNPEDAGGTSGISLELDATPAQLGKLRQLIEDGTVTPGHDKLNIVGAEIDDTAAHVPPGLDIASLVRKNEEPVRGRRLVSTLGDLKMLLVRVTDNVGKVYPDNPALMR